MELFGAASTKKRTEPLSASQRVSQVTDDQLEPQSDPSLLNTFKDLGLCEWICNSTSSVGFKRPTDIQRACIPAILRGRDVLACAETGSGKTAAFALPILQTLSEDPYGIYAIVLTPTRELAIQISEQFSILGSAFGVRMALIIGGLNIIEQGLSLSKRPHVVVATPGRLRHHLESSDAPNISKAKYLVLDEADRLLSIGFSEELELVTTRMSKRRQTLLFSATLTSSLAELEKLALSNALRFDLTTQQKIPTNLSQQYLFMPARIKMCYLVGVLQNLQPKDNANSDSNEQNNKEDMVEQLKNEVYGGGRPKKKSKKSHKNQDLSLMLSKSVIIFVGTCRRCQEICEILMQLNLQCVSLHSMMTQSMRMESLSKFKNQIVKILIATDVASRGLDIPTVDLVINYDLPKITSDYIHRIGRTARAGRQGRSLSFITQHDIDIVHAIEEFISIKMELSTEIKEMDVIPLLNPISKAMRLAQMKLLDAGFEEKVEIFKKRKRKQKRQLLRKYKKPETTEAS